MPRYFHVRLHLLYQTFVSGQLLHVRVDLPSLDRSKSFANVVSVYWHLPMELIIQPTWRYSSRKAIWLTGSRPKWHLAVSPRCCCWEDIQDASVVTSYIKTCPVEPSERSDHRVQLFKCDSYAQKWPQKKKKQVFRFQISTQCSSKHLQSTRKWLLVLWLIAVTIRVSWLITLATTTTAAAAAMHWG